MFECCSYHKDSKSLPTVFPAPKYFKLYDVITLGQKDVLNLKTEEASIRYHDSFNQLSQMQKMNATELTTLVNKAFTDKEHILKIEKNVLENDGIKVVANNLANWVKDETNTVLFYILASLGILFGIIVVTGMIVYIVKCTRKSRK